MRAGPSALVRRQCRRSKAKERRDAGRNGLSAEERCDAETVEDLASLLVQRILCTRILCTKSEARQPCGHDEVFKVIDSNKDYLQRIDATR